MNPTDERVHEVARRLYQAMPGAERVPHDDLTGEKMWGEVEDTQHYQFCEQIAREIRKAMCQCPLE
jgi:hypothetical protein